ncbi:MAG TPA: triphosphoribosyl-dephospho-CoA synthase MdcB [Legionellales bacterium]|nr:triphosphoribosyl-dephospho-CoA synthase MdcB [Legionellales bacterium]
MRNFQHSFPNPKKMARYFAKFAVCALYDELALYPKPGLVSFIDSGAHQDMNGDLLFRSLFGLRHYYFQVGLQASLNTAPNQLINLGIQAEQRMHAITGGINTHRGAIFALGIFCTSICKLSHKYQQFSTQDLQQAILSDWSEFLEKHHRNTDTHGVLVKQKYAVSDAKQMAIEGYSLVFELFHVLIETVEDKALFGLMAYQRLLLKMDDINILYRTGTQGLAFARQKIQTLSFDNQHQAVQQAIDLHHLFSKKNISPGGVADMLAVLYFLHYIFSGASS